MRMPSSCKTTAHLGPTVNFLWDSSLTTGTRCAYSTGFQTFKSFLLMVGLWTPGSSLPPVVNEDTLIYFVAHCTQMLHLTYKTIKLYLAGIRHSYLQLDVSTPLSNISSLLRLQNILKGVRKVQGDSRQKRLPITYDILCNIWQCLEHYGLSEYTKLLLQTACALAFYVVFFFVLRRIYYSWHTIFNSNQSVYVGYNIPYG